MTGINFFCNNNNSSSILHTQEYQDQTKLEGEEFHKSLSLDPYHLSHYLHLNGEDEEDQDSSISPSHKGVDPALHFQLQYLQQNHSYAGLETELDSLHPPKKRSYLLPPSPTTCFSVEYATKMGESGNHHQRPATKSSRLAVRGGMGEIVEVQGGHIVRSTGRKDRHSKVCTAKGPRDRRVRLSAHTAIQFYDVQDRLGYDRPSKAVDWLIENAKTAIDELAKLPAWNPNTVNLNAQQEKDRRQNQQTNENESPIGVHRPAVDALDSGGRRTSTVDDSGGRILEQLDENHNRARLDLLPPTFGTDIADSIKSFFPIGVSAPETNSPSIQFHNYAPDLHSRTSSACQNQDLRLSLQSLQDPILLHQAQAQAQAQTQHHQNEQLFSVTTPVGFDVASFPEEHDRFHRMVAWNVGATDTGNNGHGGGGGGGFIFNSPSPIPVLPPLFGQGQFLSQRGPLQSSNTPLIRAWIDSSIAATPDHQNHCHYLPPTIHQQSSISGGIGFDSGIYTGFRIPARIQGEEEYDGVCDKPSPASSDSRH